MPGRLPPGKVRADLVSVEFLRSAPVRPIGIGLAAPP